MIGQRKAFHRQRIPESSYARKETVDIEIPVTSRNGYKKIMQSIRITSGLPSRIKKRNHLSQFKSKSTKISIEKTSSWLHLDDGPKVQDRQQVKDQQYSMHGFMVDL